MVELLAAEKKRLIAENGEVTRQDFEAAWTACWETMKREHAWPHATADRRDWRRAQERTRREMRAAFLGEPTPFAFASSRVSEAASAMCLRLEPEQLGKAMLAAMAYVEIEDVQAAERASDAASLFITAQPESEAMAA